jgi:Flp pilus assembly protein TadB
MTTFVAVIYMLIYLRKEGRRRVVRTYTDDLVSYVWITFVVLMLLGSLIMGRIPEFYLYNYPFVLLFYGVPTFLSGIILRFRPLIYGGIICWVLAVLSTFINFHYHSLLVSAAVISAWIIPGYILKRKFKQANS